MSFNKSKFLIYGTAVLGFSMFIIGAIIYCGVIPMKLQSSIVNELVIQTNTSAYDRFVKLPITLQWKMHFFAIDNADVFDRSNHSDVRVLKFTEKGPYVFDEILEKIDVEFGDDERNVSFVEKKTYQFNSTLSGHDLDSNDTLNLVYIFIDSSSKSIASSRLSVQFIAELIQTSNKSATIKTGKDQITEIGQYMKYDQYDGKILNVWWNDTRGAKCEQLLGTDGTQFRPKLRSSTILYAFEPSLCKSIKFVNNETVIESEPVQGIDTMRFFTSKDNFNNCDENACYCLEDSLDDCQADLLNLRKCSSSKGMNILASSPYFLHNPSLLNKISIKPPKELSPHNYGTILDIEPATGLVLSVKKRIQLNVQLRRENYPNENDFLHNLTDKLAFIPLVWIEESGEIDPEDAHKLMEAISALNKAKYWMIGLMVAGAALLVTSGVIALYRL